MHQLQIETMYLGEHGKAFELIGVSKCTSIIDDRQCNLCDHNILHFKNRGQVCPVDASGIVIWHPTTKTNERW